MKPLPLGGSCRGGASFGPSGVAAAALRVAAMLVFATLLLLAAATVAFVPHARASSQFAGKEIAAAFPSGVPQPSAITAPEAILIDMDSGRILYSRNANVRVPMASTTKIMTAVLALESLKLDAKVTISANVPATIGSSLGLQKGQVLTVEQLMYALLVPSANDAAVALAETVAGSVQAFVKEMNEKAKSLGLSNTHFVNPHGLNAANHFSSARDLATLTQYAMRNPIFRRIVGTDEFSITRAGEDTPHKFENHNLLLGWQAWVTGVKTGSTPYAKNCLVASGTRDGISLISVLLGAPTDDARWSESKKLLEYGFTLYPRTVLVDKGEAVTEIAAPDPLGRQIRVVTAGPLTVSLFKSDVVTSSVTVDRDATLPVRAGEVFGSMEFTSNGKSLGSMSLIAAQSLEEPTLNLILERWKELWPPNLALRETLLTAGSKASLP